MRTVDGCEDVTLPFWDEYAYYDPYIPIPPPENTGDALPVAPGNGTNPVGSKHQVIPSVFTEKFWPPESQTPNPLFSYKFPRNVVDAADAKHRYDKHEGYQTVRFPYSGLVGTQADREDSDKWNQKFAAADGVSILNENVYRWLNQGIVIDAKGGERVPDTYSVGARYEACLNAPNYMVFSNKTSAQQYMTDSGDDAKNHIIVSLEDPHNAIHLAVGGFYQ